MAPMEIDAPVGVSRREAWKSLPPPTIYPVKENKFEKYIPPQIDGRETVKSQSGSGPAIIIDNGM
jgi:actin-related protein 5